MSKPSGHPSKHLVGVVEEADLGKLLHFDGCPNPTAEALLLMDPPNLHPPKLLLHFALRPEDPVG
jgi:hypothetical protein